MHKKLTSWILCLFCACLLLAAPPTRAAEAEAADDLLIEAMRDELARTMAELRLEELERPYFVAYTLTDSSTAAASAGFGSLISSTESHKRLLDVEVRVGDYELDNTNFLAMPRMGAGLRRSSRVTLPLDDDYRELRRQLWLATDRAYKEALEGLAKKKAALENVTRSEELPDFSRKEAAEHREEPPSPAFDRSGTEGLVTRLSSLFREVAGIQTSTVSWQGAEAYVRYVDSEGTIFTRSQPSVQLIAKASTQAEDGLPLSDFVALYGREAAELPAEEVLADEIRAMGRRLSSLRTAELLERYNGPVLFEGQAAVEVFAQVLMPKLLAQRKPVVADERLAQMMNMRGEGAADFQDRLGARILPRFLGVSDDPTLAGAEGAPEVGSYAIDDQGVPARPTTLVERGYLKTLLAGRTPVTGVETSSGSHRGGGVVPSNVIVRAERGLPGDELKEELLLLVADREAEYGILVRRVSNPAAARDQNPRAMVFALGGGRGAAPTLIEAYKVYPDGREELLRNVELVGLAPATFKEIVAAGASARPYRATASPAGASPFGFLTRRREPMVSYRVPSLLFEELTLKRPGGEIPKLPVAEHPYFAD